MTNGPMRQEAPFPEELARLVEATRYKGWRLYLRDFDRGQGSKGLTLVVTAEVEDTHNPGEQININHLFPVPAASYDRRSWQWWLFNQLLLLEQHEAMEHFWVGETQPYAPMHGPGNDPYLITVERTDEDRRTSFRGVLDE